MFCEIVAFFTFMHTTQKLVKDVALYISVRQCNWVQICKEVEISHFFNLPWEGGHPQC